MNLQANDMTSVESATLRGVLEFHSETGTEGGYWAFMDERFISPPSPDRCCRKCGTLEQQRTNGVLRAERVYPGHLFRFWEADWQEPKPCGPGKHEWVQVSTHPTYSYEGLHILANGDHLRIFDKSDASQVVWEGEIRLDSVGLFTEAAFGMWIHDDQRGIDREAWARWFFDANPAEWTEGEPTRAARRLTEHLNERLKALGAPAWQRDTVSVDGDLVFTVYPSGLEEEYPSEWEGFTVWVPDTWSARIRGNKSSPEKAWTSTDE